MSRKYKNSAIVEALCEIQFIPNQPWDMTIPGLLYERIKTGFPDKQPSKNVNVGIEAKDGAITPKLELSQRMQFYRSDKSALVQVGPDILAINHLKEYPTWEKFKPIILSIFQEYLGITNPKNIKRIGLRYINKFDFESKSIDLKKFFYYGPPTVPGLPEHLTAFNVLTELPFEEERDRLLLRIMSVVPDRPGSLSVVFDLDYVMLKPEGLSFEHVSQWIENAHSNLERAFEQSITDDIRTIMGEIK